jgi:hypothetical protein
MTSCEPACALMGLISEQPKLSISHLLNALGVSPRDLLRAFQDALITDRVASRFIEAIEFPSEKAFREYMKDHPRADPDNHSVVLDYKPPVPPKPDLPPHPPTPPKPPRPPVPPKPHRAPKLNPPPRGYKPPRFYQLPKMYQPLKPYEPPSWLPKAPKE